MLKPRQKSQTAALTAGAAVLFIAGSAFGQHWVNFVNETGSRLSAPSSIGANDPDEKDYAFADFDNVWNALSELGWNSAAAAGTRRWGHRYTAYLQACHAWAEQATNAGKVAYSAQDIEYPLFVRGQSR